MGNVNLIDEPLCHNACTHLRENRIRSIFEAFLKEIKWMNTTIHIKR